MLVRGRTDENSDGRTDRWTDERTYRHRTNAIYYMLGYNQSTTRGTIYAGQYLGQIYSLNNQLHNCSLPNTNQGMQLQNKVMGSNHIHTHPMPQPYAHLTHHRLKVHVATTDVAHKNRPKTNQRNVTLTRKGKQPWCTTFRLDTIFIAMIFFRDISNGKLVLICE